MALVWGGQSNCRLFIGAQFMTSIYSNLCNLPVEFELLFKLNFFKIYSLAKCQIEARLGMCYSSQSTILTTVKCFARCK